VNITFIDTIETRIYPRLTDDGNNCKLIILDHPRHKATLSVSLLELVLQSGREEVTVRLDTSGQEHNSIQSRLVAASSLIVVDMRRDPKEVKGLGIVKVEAGVVRETWLG
jgi:hypothetical protein